MLACKQALIGEQDEKNICQQSWQNGVSSNMKRKLAILVGLTLLDNNIFFLAYSPLRACSQDHAEYMFHGFSGQKLCSMHEESTLDVCII